MSDQSLAESLLAERGLNDHNVLRVSSWWERYTAHTGAAPDISQHVNQLSRGLKFPSELCSSGRLRLRTVGDARLPACMRIER